MAGERAERVWWRAWSLCGWVALGALAVHGWIRLDLLGGAGRPGACDVTAGADEVLPADCWLPMGWFGIRRWSPSWTDAGWRALAVAGAAAVIGSAIARSAARRQALLIRLGGLWVLGGVAAGWAFERNVVAATGSGPGWPLRLVGWAPLALAVGLVHGFWSASPWRTLERPGLRARRRAAVLQRARRAERRAEVRDATRELPARVRTTLRRLPSAPVRLVGRGLDAWADWVLGPGGLPPLPEVQQPAPPVRLTWPVPASDLGATSALRRLAA